MKKYKTLTDWLKSNPPLEEQRILINLLNKGVTNETVKQIYDLKRYYRKLIRGERYRIKRGHDYTEDTKQQLKKVKAQITELSEGLPATYRSAKKDE